MKNKKKIKICKFLVLFGFVLIALFASVFIIFVKTTWGVTLDKARLISDVKQSQIEILDVNSKNIDTDYFFTGKVSVDVNELPSHVKNAFIAVEDKRFYKHNGVDYKRLLGAVVNNIKSRSFSQGASTISQQLIKNTHLTREKTITRKLKEIKLAYILEKEFSKDEILEMYLNNIYFGNGCYGLEKAANFYFNKKANELSVGESALLVSTINAPSVYDPINNIEGVEKRKRLILKLMNNQGYINNEIYEKSAKNMENIRKNNSKQQNNHLQIILQEACSKLKVSANHLKNMSLKIETYIDVDFQNYVSDLVEKRIDIKTINNNRADCCVLVLDNETKGVVAVKATQGFNILKNKRQPGSTIKPVLVYAPALEYGLIYPESVVVDEKINYNGYSPSNANKSFQGKVSIREAIEKSLNIPAVKTLSKVGIKRAKEFAQKTGITFSNKDQNLALALGGMTDGLTLLQLADSYSTFASGGMYKKSGLIKRITDSNGDVLFEDEIKAKQVMSPATAYMINDLLKGVVNNGTARRMNVFDFDVASKTGTVGVSGVAENTDAYNVSYTADYTVVSWVGVLKDSDRLSSLVNGSTYPTIISKEVLHNLHEKNKPEKFDIPSDIEFRYIDNRSLLEGDLKLANNETSPSLKKLSLFNKDYLPEVAKLEKPKSVVLKIDMEENQKPELSFDALLNQEYVILRKELFNNEFVELKSFKNCEKTQKYTDLSVKSGKIYEYFIETRIKDGELVEKSNKIKLMAY